MEGEEDCGRKGRQRYIYANICRNSSLPTANAGIEAQLKEVRNYNKEYTAHLEALKNGDEFTPKLTGKLNAKSKPTSGKKRKRSGKGGKKGSPKRRKSVASDDDEDDEMLGSDDQDMDDDIDSDIESDGTISDNSDQDDASGDDDSDKSGSDSESSQSDDDDDDEVTQESLEAKILDAKNAIKAGRERLTEVRKEKKEAIDALAGLKKKQAKVQIEKNSFCSLKRSEVCKDPVLCIGKF